MRSSPLGISGHHHAVQVKIVGLQLCQCAETQNKRSDMVRRDLHYHEINTTGSISFHINSNKEGDGGRNDHWMDYNVGW